MDAFTTHLRVTQFTVAAANTMTRFQISQKVKHVVVS